MDPLSVPYTRADHRCVCVVVPPAPAPSSTAGSESSPALVTVLKVIQVCLFKRKTATPTQLWPSKRHDYKSVNLQQLPVTKSWSEGPPPAPTLTGLPFLLGGWHLSVTIKLPEAPGHSRRAAPVQPLTGFLCSHRPSQSPGGSVSSSGTASNTCDCCPDSWFCT